MSNTLRLGSTGADVENLQSVLSAMAKIALGMGMAPIQVDGSYGPDTERAVKQAQHVLGLDEDGVAGPETFKSIAAFLISHAAPASEPKPASTPTGTPWMDWMRKHVGEMEQTGTPPTAFDREVFQHTDTDLRGKMLAGCAATVCAALEETGFKSTHNAAAASFLKYGAPCELKYGAILVFQWASGEHHVTFCDQNTDGDLVQCLGGNQSHRLKDSTYERKYVVGIRWPQKQ